MPAERNPCHVHHLLVTHIKKLYTVRKGENSMDLKIPDFTKDIDFESTPLKNIEKASTETAVQSKRLAELAERRAQKAEQDAKDADASAKRANAIAIVSVIIAAISLFGEALGLFPLSF